MESTDTSNCFSPELALLIASCTGGSTGKGTISGIDGEKLLSLARWHNVRPSLLIAMKAESGDWVAALRQECREITLSNLLNAQETTRLLNLLEEEGITAYGYKGCLWAEWLYGQHGLREYGDIDLLTGQKDFERALHLITEAGYEPDPYRHYLLNDSASLRKAFFRTDYHIPMLRNMADSSLQFVLEMHWRVAYPRLEFNFPEPEWPEFQQQINTQSGSILGFSNEYQLLLLIMHHGGKEEWLKLKYLTDLAAYLNRHGKVTDWQLVEKLASRKGILKQVWQGLGMLRGLGMPWNNSWPDVMPVSVNPELLQKWETMPRAVMNSSLAYFYHTLATRDTFWQKVSVAISHLHYLFELNLLYRKFLWYTRTLKQ